MSAFSLSHFRQSLLNLGYRDERIRNSVPLSLDPSRIVDFVAYSDQPFDARTSALALVDGSKFDEGSLSLLRQLGAPVIAQHFPDHVTFWKQSGGAPTFIERVPKGKIASFFQAHREELAPQALYRAKVWGRMDEDRQYRFVDVGLLPVIEQEAGEDLRKLLEEAVTQTKAELGWKQDISVEDGRWLLKSVFWLLAAKILKDKGVPGFARLDLCELETVYLKLAKHYHKDDPRPVQIKNSRRRDALLLAAEKIRDFGHCGAVTTESLAWVYESALIDRATRQKFGTHSTPTWLIDDVVSKLRPWIEEMPVDERRVFEPACGHAGFLISAMRLLSELLPAERASERKAYLRKRLHGIEIDSFAFEVARLSLTLADVPNDNGWMLENTDMFAGETLSSAIANSNIVLANPPFEKFGDSRPEGAMHSQADETFRHIVESLPVGGVFGVVMPQGILHSTQAKELRQKLLTEYEISEITLFADKVFNYGEPETAVILGRRVGTGQKPGKTLYRRVREDQIETYKKTLVPSSSEGVHSSVFESLNSSLLVPELSDVWHVLRNHPKLGRFVEGGKGFEHKGKDDPTLPQGVIRESETEAKGFTKGFSGWGEDQFTHLLPKPVWLNLDPKVIRRPLHGTSLGREQLLINYARVSRGVWRLKVLCDYSGHPVTSRFIVYRPQPDGPPLQVLWGILNSPLSNAYAYAHSSKRDVLSGTINSLPVIDLRKNEFNALEHAIEQYFAAAKGSHSISAPSKHPKAQPSKAQLSLALTGEDSAPETNEEELKYLHWRIDAEVLRLYDLPASTERRILDLFTGVQRRGVPFVQNEYFPKGFGALNRLSELLAITADWEVTNRRRCSLIRKDVKGKLTAKEKEELKHLEHLADARIEYMDLLHPSEPDEIQRTVERLKREGKWTE